MAHTALLIERLLQFSLQHSLIGELDGIRKRRDVLQTVLPLIVLGGMMYHMLFEAKSQYAYVYAVLLVPMAARGLCLLEDGIRGRIKEQRHG